MKTITLEAEVTADQMLKLEVPCDLPPGPVEVVLTIQPQHGATESGQFDWKHLFGLGREVWLGVDADAYVRDLRADRDRGT